MNGGKAGGKQPNAPSTRPTEGVGWFSISPCPSWCPARGTNNGVGEVTGGDEGMPLLSQLASETPLSTTNRAAMAGAKG